MALNLRVVPSTLSGCLKSQPFFFKAAKSAVLFLYLIAFPGSFNAENLRSEGGEDRNFRIRGEIQSGYEYRDRDTHTGVYDTDGQSQGFNLRQTSITVEKLIPESHLVARARFLVTRADAVNEDAGAAKSNPYVLYARQAWIGWQFNSVLRGVLGIQEVPMDYSMIRLCWALNYVLPEPHESMRITDSRSAAGIGMQANWDHFINFNVMIANPEPEFQAHGTQSNGYDAMARFSAVPTGRIGRFHFGFHFFYRWKNILGITRGECQEGRSNCLRDDGNALTLRNIEPHSNQDRIYGTEFTYRQNPSVDSGIGFSLGGYVIENPGGKIVDSLHPFNMSVYRPPAEGQVVFMYLRTGFRNFTLFYRYQAGTGSTGYLTAARSHINLIQANFDEQGRLRTPGTTLYGDRSFFKKDLYGMEYRLDERWSFSIGLENTRLFGATGEEDKVYVDPSGRQRTQDDFRSQFLPGGPAQGITPYSRNSRQYFLRTSIVF